MVKGTINSDMIAEGIDKSIVGQILKGIVSVLLIFGIILVLLVGYGLYSNWKYEKENCGESGCPITTTMATPICKIELVDCIVVDKSLIKYSNSTGGGALPIIMEMHHLCGYQEANAWFEQYKKQIDGGDELYLECS